MGKTVKNVNMETDKRLKEVEAMMLRDLAKFSTRNNAVTVKHGLIIANVIGLSSGFAQAKRLVEKSGAYYDELIQQYADSHDLVSKELAKQGAACCKMLSEQLSACVDHLEKSIPEII